MKYLVTEVQSSPGGATSTPTYAYDSKVIGSQSEAELAAQTAQLLPKAPIPAYVVQNPYA